MGPAGSAHRRIPRAAAAPAIVGTAIDITDAATTWTTTVDWLKAIYHNDTIQQMYKDQLISIFQGITESPNAFYTRIRHLVELAGYADGVRDQVLESALVNSLNQKIALIVRAPPMSMTLIHKIDYAHRYWTARHLGKQRRYSD